MSEELYAVEGFDSLFDKATAMKINALRAELDKTKRELANLHEKKLLVGVEKQLAMMLEIRKDFENLPNLENIFSELRTELEQARELLAAYREAYKWAESPTILRDLGDDADMDKFVAREFGPEAE